ncbi:macrophage mannose receptor 1-like [Oncorhynchus nerka]|uniref:macrophage mannose receptor 1-like n=1 Tax=Oncorhynchus nerka TaxID=8023 RepID=UPI0011314D92|nr:macrophage mannose receptor 1-like [Oncorhynchus nerka]
MKPPPLTMQWSLSLCSLMGVALLAQMSSTSTVNVALQGVATQSSQYSAVNTNVNDVKACNAIDGNKDPNADNGSCTHTMSETNPWWRVNLLDVYKVTRVVITNRNSNPERLNGSEIHIGNSLENNGNNNPTCTGISSISAGQNQTFQCKEMEGHYVSVIIRGNNKILTLCEVEVYGSLAGHCSSETCLSHDEYQFVNQNKTWTEAQSYCRQWYTDLATIDNVEDLDRQMKAVHSDYTEAAWIGLKKGDGKGEWQWSDNDCSEGYFNWSRDEPNNREGNEDCVMMSSGGQWNTSDCNNSHAFICYDRLNSSGTKFHFINNTQMTWRDAQMYCRENHTDLASVRNQTENEEIIRMASGDSVWIGLFRGFWKWSDQSNCSFRNWHERQHDNTGGNQTCAVTFMNYSGRWGFQKCDEKQPFFCYHNKVILIHQNKTWKDALAYCKEHHSDLVSVYSHKVQRWVEAQAKRASTPHVWLGLRFTCTLNIWFWVSGESTCYNNWASGNGTVMEDCMKTGVRRTGAVEKDGRHQWVRLPDTEELNFICTSKKKLESGPR